MRSGVTVSTRPHRQAFAAVACVIALPGVVACREPPTGRQAAASTQSVTAAPAASPAVPSVALPPASASAVPAGVGDAWAGTFRATTSDPYVDEERKTRYRTRHVLLSVQRDGAFRVKLTAAPVDELDAAGGCETRGRLQQREGALWAVEEATTCAPIAKLPREVALKLEWADPCLLRWVHPSGGLSGGVLDLGLKKRDCAPR